jgi:hypothetical protein
MVLPRVAQPLGPLPTDDRDDPIGFANGLNQFIAQIRTGTLPRQIEKISFR